MNRINRELEALRAEVPDIEIGKDGEYFIIPDFCLPADVFDAVKTRILVVIPPTYPTAPPDNFHVTWGLAVKGGASINNYSGPTALYGETWGTFSFHSDGGWNPNHDSLLTFLTAVKNRLQEGA